MGNKFQSSNEEKKRKNEKNKIIGFKRRIGMAHCKKLLYRQIAAHILGDNFL